jgi:DNA-directed RNA polymerase specialized sigma24 family protein
MPSAADITSWLEQFKAGDREAAAKLWGGYVRRMLGLARKKLGGLPRRGSDEEDVALSAFASFCRRAEQGGFARLDDRDDLWQLLALITTRKAADLVARERAQKRGGGEVRGESAFAQPPDDPGEERGIEQVAARELTPEEVAELVEEHRRLLDLLGDDTLRQVALLKLEGHTHREIAGRLGLSLASVGRQVALIRDIWEAHAGS